jgi:AbrB family looped-hinge helix DNA binding protein
MVCENMAKYEKPELIVLSSKGQVVIPQAIRQRLGLKAKSQLLAYRYKDAVVLKKVRMPDAVREMERIWRSVDRRIEKYGLKRLTGREIAQEIERYRREKSLLK